MTTVRNPAPVDVPTQTTTIPLSQIDRAPAPVSAASDPSITGSGTSTVTTPPVSEQSVDPTGATIGGGTVVVNQPPYLAVEDEGSVALDRTTVLNFVGNAVTVIKTGSSTATVTIANTGSGSQGATGSQGIIGTTGAQGTTGIQGTIGAQGETGTGIQGTTGAQGVQGPAGSASSYGDSNVATLLGAFGSNVISTTGNITGNIVAPDGNGSMMINANGVIGAAPGTFFDSSANMFFVPGLTAQGNANSGIDALYVGIGGYTVLGSTVIAQLTSNVNQYSQINQQNVNTGVLASGDYIITADNGTDSTYYLDIGLAGSNHADPDFFGDTTSNNDAYMYVAGASETGPSSLSGPGNLILGSTNGVIKLFVGNTAQANVITTVTSDGVSVVGNISTTGVVSAAGFISSPVLLANLTAVAGSRAFASDANLVAAGNFGQQVSGGASNTVPVWSDGTNWYIG